MTTVESRERTGLVPVEVVVAELVEDDGSTGSGAVAVHDPAAAVLAALEKGAEEELNRARAHKTRTGYARDWEVWREFHDWLGEQTGHRLPDTAVTRGTVVAFVTWLDEVVKAPPSTIDRRVTGVTVTARRPPYGVQVPKEATLAARELIRKYKNDPQRMARGRGQAEPATPEHLRRMHTANPLVPRRPDSRRRRQEYVLPDMAVYRNQALTKMAWAISGRAAEVSALEISHIKLTDGGLEVHVPSVKGRPPREVEVAYGEHPDSCPVLAWLAWQGAAELTEGPAFRSVDQWGHLGSQRLSPDGCRLVITRAGKQAGIEVTLTGHSARAGFITTAIEQGKRPDQVRQQSGHAAKSAVFWEYVRKAQRWHNPVSRGIGL
ncbi:tyrosine-type recombinase/integrase (plasmid) [Streptomyces sp. NBC_00873]|uniref:tyrosine-type recombinase/integrase n=1 Tax=unclassified Streptomyces TaxID=2593676 RepID=UPI002F9183EC|nr:tyrosine-type recombinase/integrase [Streptomyces sp. NBC_00873]WTA49282.1 tyrosine-type recombinase/integrase [Streptomyces sp. NBC_00842]